MQNYRFKRLTSLWQRLSHGCKAYIGASLLYFSLLLTINLVSLYALNQGISSLAQDIFQCSLDSIHSALNYQLEDLKRFSQDWTSMYETKTIFLNQDFEQVDRYLQRELRDEIFQQLDISLALFVDPSGKILFSKVFDPLGKSLNPVSTPLIASLLAEDSLLHFPDLKSSRGGLLDFDQQTLLVVSSPVVSTGNSQELLGAIILGRSMDSHMIQEIAQATHLPLTAYSAHNPQLPPDFQSAWLSLTKKSQSFFFPSSKMSNAGYVILKDLYDQPTLILRIGLPPEVYSQGSLTAGHFTLLLWTVGLFVYVPYLSSQRKIIRSKLAQRESEDQIRFQAHLLNSVGQAVIATDVEGRITYWNRAAETIFGWPAAEVLGKNILQTTGMEKMVDHEQEIYDRLRKGQSWSMEFSVRRRDGSSFPAILTGTPVFNESGELAEVIGVTTDITERKHHEKAMEALLAISAELRCANTLDELLPLLLDKMIEYLRVSASGLALLHPTRGNLQLQLGRGSWSHRTDDSQIDSPVYEIVLKQCQIYLSNDSQNDPLLAGSYWSAGLQSIALVPLIAQNQTLGVLGIGRNSQIFADDLNLMTAIADMAASAIRRETLHQQTHRYAEQLSTVSAVGQALTETLDLNQIYEHLKQTVINLLPETDTFLLSLYDPHQNRITCVYGFQGGEPIDPSELPSLPLAEDEEDMLSQVIRTRRPLLVDEMPNQDKIQNPVITSDPKRRTQCALYMPMLARSEVIGLVQIQSYTPNGYSETDMKLLSFIANAAAIAIDNSQLFHRIQNHADLVSRLVPISENLNRSFTLDSVAQAIGEGVQMLTGADCMAIFGPHPDQGLSSLWFQGFSPESLVRTLPRVRQHLQSLNQIQSKVIQVSNLPAGFADPVLAEVVDSEGLRAAVICPLMYEQRVLACVAGFYRTPRTLSEGESETLEAFCRQAAIALANTCLYEELQESYMQTVLALARTVDARDTYTANHSQDIAKWAEQIARTLGCSEDEIQTLLWAAQLHDIGKIGVPDAILRKPGPLSLEEWEIMQRHPEIGAEILSPIKKLSHCTPLVGAHHEKWDGSGYPNGLSGNRIPLGARILSAVDAYSAMTDDRVYRKAISKNDAMAELHRCAGNHFDPQVVEIFLEILASQDNPQSIPDSTGTLPVKDCH